MFSSMALTANKKRCNFIPWCVLGVFGCHEIWRRLSRWWQQHIIIPNPNKQQTTRSEQLKQKDAWFQMQLILLLIDTISHRFPHGWLPRTRHFMCTLAEPCSELHAKIGWKWDSCGSKIWQMLCLGIGAKFLITTLRDSSWWFSHPDQPSNMKIFLWRWLQSVKIDTLIALCCLGCHLDLFHANA